LVEARLEKANAANASSRKARFAVETQAEITQFATRPPVRKSVRRARVSTSKSSEKPFERLGTPATFAANQKIFSAGEPADFLYRVESGCVRSYSNFNNDRRIHAFYFPGDYVGLEEGDAYTISADAVTESGIRVIKRQALMARAAREIAVVKLLLDITAKDLHRSRNHNQLLMKGAQDRIVDFLLELKARGQNGSEVDLPMSRRDIADHLGLTIETVSRGITRLRNASAISMLTSRRLIVRDVALAYQS
jgi:CRP/FNR family transcriptional regulator, nitrogen fixation regulation protein